MCPYRLLTTHHPVPPFQPTLTRPDTTDRACCILAPPCTLPQSGAGWAPLRWLLAYWAGVHGSVHLADWDESDAFCNIPREDLPALLDDTAPGLGAWLQQFYGSLQIRSSTPYGLTEPFPMIHGGGQATPAASGRTWRSASSGRCAIEASTSMAWTHDAPPVPPRSPAPPISAPPTTPPARFWSCVTATTADPWPPPPTVWSCCLRRCTTHVGRLAAR